MASRLPLRGERGTPGNNCGGPVQSKAFGVMRLCFLGKSAAPFDLENCTYAGQRRQASTASFECNTIIRFDSKSQLVLADCVLKLDLFLEFVWLLSCDCMDMVPSASPHHPAYLHPPPSYHS